MTRRSVIWALMVGVPVAAAGTFAGVQAGGAGAAPLACCDPDCCPPGCCPDAATATPQPATTDCCPPGCCATAGK